MAAVNRVAPLPHPVRGVNVLLRIQTACPATFAALILDAEPLDPHEGVEFVNAAPNDPRSGPTPNEFVHATEAGVRAALLDPTTGEPLFATRLVLRHMRWHEIDSKERDFVRAGERAIREVLACIHDARDPQLVRGR